MRVQIAYFSVLLCNKFLRGTYLHTARRQPLIGCTITGLDTDEWGRDVVIMEYKLAGLYTSFNLIDTHTNQQCNCVSSTHENYRGIVYVQL